MRKLRKDLAFFTSKNSMIVSNFWAKENTNVECKSENDSGIQDESQKCENFPDFLFNIRKHHCNKTILMISEIKLDDTFPHALYHLKDFSSSCILDRNPYKLDRWRWNLGLPKG